VYNIEYIWMLYNLYMDERMPFVLIITGRLIIMQAENASKG